MVGYGAKAIPEGGYYTVPKLSVGGCLILGDSGSLLNGQRTSGYQDIGSLPPEAIDKVEVLPEPAALKFGYPPSRRISPDARQMCHCRRHGAMTGGWNGS